MQQAEVNEELMRSVEYVDLDAVQSTLQKGADPNYVRRYNNDLADEIHQPTTPLRMVMFRISDSLLEDHHLVVFAEIAKVLIKHGADPKPAMELAELRYGKYDRHTHASPFMDVWHVVANALNS